MPFTRDTVTLAQFQYTVLSIPVVLPAGSRTPGEVIVTATYVAPDGSTLTSATHTYITPGVATYGLSITPKTLSLTAAPHATSNRLDFTVRATGNVDFVANGGLTCTGFVINCLGPDNSPIVSVSALLSGQTLHVTFDVDTTKGRSGTLKLGLTGWLAVAAADTATLTILSNGTYANASVSPHSLQSTLRPSVDVIQRFDITNSGTQSARLRYTAACTGGASCTSVTDSTATLATGQLQSVNVTVHTGTVGTVGNVRLIAFGSSGTTPDTGTVAIAVANVSPIVVSAASVNPGTTVARDGCVTIAAGVDAAYECGDLRLAHPLPATTTMNRTRAPTLIYNSSQARGLGIVAANVAVAPGTSVSTLHATLRFPSGQTATRDVAWQSSWTDGLPRRIAVPFDAVALSLLSPSQPTGVVKYTLEVRAVQDTTIVGRDTGFVVVVDRHASPFGQGWWLDGLEQLSFVTPDSLQRLWIGGDGNARLYTRRTATLWIVTPTVDRPDTLELVGTNYRRHLGNGAYVEFDGAGRHVRTVNSLGHVTTFAYGGSGLASISLPVPVSAPAVSYTINYANGYLASVDAPPANRGPRHVAIARLASGNTAAITSITDPGLPAVAFTVDGFGAIVARTNRLGHATHFGFDPPSHLLIADTVDLAPADGAPLVSTFCPAEATSVAACASTPRDTATIRTHYVGARYDRSDSTDFYTTVFGAPKHIVDAAGHASTIERRDSHWPLLATAVVDPLGHRVETVYDTSRGLPLSTTDVNRFATTSGGASPQAVTTYVWGDNACAEVTLITAPTGETQSFTYDHPYCTRHSQRDGNGDSTTVTFLYDAANRVSDISRPITQHGGKDHYDYDARRGGCACRRRGRRSASQRPWPEIRLAAIR